MAVVKEFVAIGPDVVKEGSPLELHERLIMAAPFALNGLF
jgi:alcohol dehydrogenase YqhD (iron-dependent ADH family)